MSQTPTTTGPRQPDPQTQPTQTPAEVPSPPPAPNSAAENEHINARARVLLNEFLAKTQQPVACELGNDDDFQCTICSTPFLRGGNPEVPVRLECGHVFGMNCILKWLSPVSRNGNNSCPNCRKAIFEDWDKMDFPVSRRIAGSRRRVVAAPVRGPGMNPYADRTPVFGPNVDTEPTRAPPTTVIAADASRGQLGPLHPPWALDFPRYIRVGRPAPTAVTTEPVDVTATTSSVTAIPGAVAPNAPSPSPVTATQEASDQQQVVEGPQTVATNESRALEMSTPDDTTSSLPPSVRRRARRAGSPLSDRDWDHAIARNHRLEAAQRRARSVRSSQIERYLEHEAGVHLDPYEAAHRPAAAVSPAIAEAARPTGYEEDNGVVSMFNAAELQYNRQRQQEVTDERKRCMWMQFCEGVVRTIEQSNDSTAFVNHDLALTIINMKDLDEFMAERGTESPIWRRILQTFPRLHTEMVTRFNDFRPLPSVNINNRMELERLLVYTKFNRETLHKARWYTRLSERLACGAATSNHEAAVARLTERVANFSGVTGETTASTSSSSAQRTREEAREMRRMEDYLLGRTPITIRREAAASVDAALRAGAELNLTTTRVTRL
ncbi:MAG: hypothetical protein ALECFALPRED_003386 [Alectoria fallacina]|uniref:RING-type domain-containing protein n=1 Tax=Alectoria fallacina TaxID=1903189 RepID=A0A8H3FHS0_9LECA|nr:MAG: hypothetical protein ALECFALPRED_003386 [Alectoria fallacina]